jgi:anaerobic magnesium-protoporphyrin IX monomethyl ester cyclase
MLTNKLYAEWLFREIKEVGIPFAFLARVEHLTEDIVKLAAECGCKYISIGVECGDEEFRKKHLNRHMTNEEIIGAFKLCGENGIYTTELTMIGFPFGNDNELTASTIGLITKIKPDYLQTSIFYPFVGTPLYDHCVKNDLIDPMKQKRVTSCFEESILRDVNLKKKRDDILKHFNKKPFLDGIKW